jgi:hypothetical protein
MRWLVVFFALVGIGFSGCLVLDAPDGELMCSTVAKRACPAGYYCLAGDNTCWRYGDFPADMAEPMPFSPGGPDDLSVEMDDLSPPADMTPNADLLETD